MPATAAAQPGGGGAGAGRVRLSSAQGRLVLLAAVLGSGMAFLDGTVVNVALPRIGEDLGADLAGLQWTVNGYALTLAGLILIGGSLGDRLGRRRIFSVGVAWFAVASLLCAVAPTIETLIAARAVQGVGAALLTPGSLALLEATFHPDDRGAAIGAWSGLAGVSTAFGPFLGGWLVDAVSWRLVFLINLPLAAAVLWSARAIPESSDPAARGTRLDWPGAVLVAVGLAGLAYALTEGPQGGWEPLPVAAGLGGVACIAAFLVVEARTAHPLVPLGMFRSRAFSTANAMTFVVYGALGAGLFLLPIQLQQVAGYSPLQAGSALIPMTIVMLLLSTTAGRLAQRIGPRVPMGVGPIVAGAGLALLTRAGEGASYVADVLPGVLVFALGMAITVAPLSVTVLAAAGAERSGIASGVNNAVARVASLLAVAVIPAAAGISGDDYLVPEAFDDGFVTGVLICAAMCVLGGVIVLVALREPSPAEAAGEGEHAPPPPHSCLNGPPPDAPGPEEAPPLHAGP